MIPESVAARATILFRMSFAMFVAVAFACLYYAWGRQEYGSGIAMAALSGGVSGLTMLMGWKFVGVFAAQAGLGVIFVAYHLSRPMKKHF